MSFCILLKTYFIRKKNIFSFLPFKEFSKRMLKVLQTVCWETFIRNYLQLFYTQLLLHVSRSNWKPAANTFNACLLAHLSLHVNGMVFVIALINAQVVFIVIIFTVNLCTYKALTHVVVSKCKWINVQMCTYVCIHTFLLRFSFLLSFCCCCRCCCCSCLCCMLLLHAIFIYLTSLLMLMLTPVVSVQHSGDAGSNAANFIVCIPCYFLFFCFVLFRQRKVPTYSYIFTATGLFL